MTLYYVAGMSKQIDLPVPLIIDLIPPSQKNQRPGYALHQPPNWIQHETGNSGIGADARMHDRYLHGGAMAIDPETGRAYSQVLSFHFAVDDKAIYQMIPVNEVTWQAADGAGPGNYQCISCELCINRDGDEHLARRNAESLCGQIMKAFDRPLTAVGRHWDYNYNDPGRHHCPDHMMSSGYWPQFVANVGVFLADTPPAQYPAPYVIPNMSSGAPVLVKDNWWFPVNLQVECVKKAVPRIYASTTAKQAAPTIEVKTKKKVIAYVKTEVAWLILDDHTRVLASSFTPAITLKVR